MEVSRALLHSTLLGDTPTDGLPKKNLASSVLAKRSPIFHNESLDALTRTGEG